VCLSTLQADNVSHEIDVNIVDRQSYVANDSIQDTHLDYVQIQAPWNPPLPVMSAPFLNWQYIYIYIYITYIIYTHTHTHTHARARAY